MTDISALPPEILNMCFAYLDPSELAIAARVCKAWEQLANESKHWHIFYSKLIRKIQNDVTKDSMEIARKFATGDLCDDKDGIEREEKALDDLVSDIKSKFTSPPDENNLPVSNDINYKEAFVRSNAVVRKNLKKAKTPESNHAQQYSSFFGRGMQKMHEKKQAESNKVKLIIPTFILIFAALTFSGVKLVENEKTGEWSQSLFANLMTAAIITVFLVFAFFSKENQLRRESRSLLGDLAEIAKIKEDYSHHQPRAP